MLQIGTFLVLLLRFLLPAKCDRAGPPPVARSHQIRIGEMADEYHASQLVFLFNGSLKQLVQCEQIPAVLMDLGVPQFDGNRVGPISLGAEIRNQPLDMWRQILGPRERFEDSLLDQHQQPPSGHAAAGDRFECLDLDHAVSILVVVAKSPTEFDCRGRVDFGPRYRKTRSHGKKQPHCRGAAESDDASIARPGGRKMLGRKANQPLRSYSIRQQDKHSVLSPFEVTVHTPGSKEGAD